MENMKPSMGILGISGRMGAELDSLLSQPTLQNRLGVIAKPKRSEGFSSLLKCDVVIEFSSPAAALELIREIHGPRPAVVIGSTGWTSEQETELHALAKKITILRASNFSLGIQVCKMTLGLWKNFPELKSWDVRIREWHHRDKKDSPSGTALTLQQEIEANAPIESIREGETVGTHEVIFENALESLTLIHTSKHRTVFASGAIDTGIRLAEMLNSSAERNSLPQRVLGLDDLYLRSEA